MSNNTTKSSDISIKMDIQNKPGRLEKIFGIISIIILSQAFIPHLRRETSIAAQQFEGDPFLQTILTIIYVITGILILINIKKTIKIITNDKLIWALIGLAFISIFWSAYQPLTFRRCMALVGTTVFGLYLSVRYEKMELVKIFAWGLGIPAVASILLAIFLPTYGIEPHYTGRSWRGAWDHKNIMAKHMALGVVCFFFLALYMEGWKRRLAWIGFIICLVLVGFSNAKTSWIFIFDMILLGICLRVLRLPLEKSLPIAVLMIVFVFLSALWVMDNTEMILKGLQRDATLTGRTELWSVLIPYAKERFWLGYGYGSFWDTAADQSVVWTVLYYGMQPSIAHNSFLDLWLELGMVGVILFLASIFKNIITSFKIATKSKVITDYWPLVYMFFILSYSMTESAIMGQTSLTWAIYVAITFQLSQIKQDEAEVDVKGQNSEAPSSRSGLERKTPGRLAGLPNIRRPG